MIEKRDWTDETIGPMRVLGKCEEHEAPTPSHQQWHVKCKCGSVSLKTTSILRAQALRQRKGKVVGCGYHCSARKGKD